MPLEKAYGRFFSVTRWCLQDSVVLSDLKINDSEKWHDAIFSHN